MNRASAVWSCAHGDSSSNPLRFCGCSKLYTVKIHFNKRYRRSVTFTFLDFKAKGEEGRPFPHRARP